MKPIPQAAGHLKFSTRGIRLCSVIFRLVITGLAIAILEPKNSEAQAVVGFNDAHANAPVVRAAQGAGAIQVDGRLNERAWSAATPVTAFTQTDPREGSPASERTEVRVLYGNDALYIGARLYDSSGRVSSRLARRDARPSDSDEFTVTLDSRHDHLTAFRFSLNPAGVKGDAVVTEGSKVDNSWDPVWEGAARVDADGWTAEFRIPFSQLRFSETTDQLWGVQFTRRISRTQEQSVFAFTPKRERGGVARYGHLTGIVGIQLERRLEVLPYTAMRAEYVHVPASTGVGFSNPYRDGSNYLGSAGLDLKYRLTSNVVVDATFNPDFGQVEADPAEVNLTAFETRFAERRPFFVEGTDIFEFGGSRLFYSRRIGRRPQATLPSGAIYRQVPEASTILGAAKLSGKTAGGWSIGVLEAMTAPEEARFMDRAGVEHRAAVEPFSNYFVGRVRKDLRAGQTVVGAMVTSTLRDLSDDGLANRLRSGAQAGGIDFQHAWANRTWSVIGSAASSLITGNRRVITAAQNSSARFYGRPDAAHLELDPTATSLRGYTAAVDVGKRAGLHWTGSIAFSATSPGYEINDLGFQTLADRLGATGTLNYAEYQPGPVFQQWSAYGSLGNSWNYGIDDLGSRFSAGASGTFKDYSGATLSVFRSFAGWDDRLTLGGPLARGVSETGIDGNWYSDPRKEWTQGAFAGYADDSADGWRLYAGFNVGWKPASNWDLSVGPYLDRYRYTRQYLASIPDTTALSTYGRRYVFADLSQTSVSMAARLNVTFTPDLGFSLYAQPFVSSNHFGTPKELAEPGTLTFARYGSDAGTLTYDGGARSYTIDPDGNGSAASFQVFNSSFNTTSLRGNAVLRWEYRPGSTLFVVWQQNRGTYLDAWGADPADPSVGRFYLVRDTRGLFSAPADNVLMLKVSYWLNP